MGVYLDCYVNFAKVSPQKWEEVYFETLDWLYKCPLPLIRNDIVRGGSGNLKRIYTKDIVDNKGRKKECWSIVGDEESYLICDKFNLYRHLNRILEGKKKNLLGKQSVFYAEGDDITLEDSKYGINAWGNKNSKTEGNPIHLALLAVGMWMEYRLPGLCFMQGDLSKPLAERVLDWMRGLSNEPLEMPVVLNEKRLWEYTKEAFDDSQLAMRRFFVLYKGDEVDAYAFFFESDDRGVLMEMLAKDLSDFSSLGALDCLGVIRRILRVSGDVELLIKLIDMSNELKLKENAVKEEEEKIPLFEMEDLLKELCEELVMVNPALKESIMVLDEFSADENFMSIFMMLSELRKYDPKVYVPEKDLFEAFMYRAPKKGKHFKKIIDKAVAKHEKILKKYNKKMDGLMNTYETALEKQKSELEENGIDIEKEEAAAGDGIFMATAWLKKQKYKDEEMAFRIIGKYLRDVFPEFEHVFWGDANRLKGKLFKIAFKIGLVFHEDALAELKGLKDLRLLSLMCILVCHNEGIGKNKEEFKLWFAHFFRHPKFWPLLLSDD